MMLGYLDDPAATSAAIDADGWLHTGDVGRLDAAGYLTITDRLKDMYICGGFNVYPAEVEQVLARLDGVAESAVVGVPDGRLGEVGRAYIVTRRGRATVLTRPQCLTSAARGSPTTRCPGRWSSATHCRVTRRARSSSGCFAESPDSLDRPGD